MLRHLRQARAAFSMLSAAEVLKQAEHHVHFGLVADSSNATAEMEEFLMPAGLNPTERELRRAQVHWANEEQPPEQVDVVLYESGLPCPQDAYIYYREDPLQTVKEILDEKPELGLSLARQFPAFRAEVVDRLIHAVARENAVFALATALPNIVPTLFSLPWAFGEFASDTAFITVNQVRMAFQVAAACGKDPGLEYQKFEVMGIVGGAFGWRALARELAGHIPLGGGLIPKGAIAYAGTYATGKGLEALHLRSTAHTSDERKNLYQRGLERGRAVVRAWRSESGDAA